MGKKATVNGFTEGLSMDLNALTDTKETLIDALNATLVTGNGNEMILQNDDGNVKIKYKDSNDSIQYAQLGDDHIPIGITEYGGIIYIVSLVYTNNRVQYGEIGCFPSPSNWKANKEEPNSLIYKYSPLGNATINYKKQTEDTIESISIPNSPLQSSYFNFDLQHPVQIEIQKSYDNSVNLIINDGKNIPRLINSGFVVLSGNKYKIPTKLRPISYDIEALTLPTDTDTIKYSKVDVKEKFNIDTSLIKRVKSFPSIKFRGVINNGSLKVGNYVFYFKYADEDGNETDFVQESSIVACFQGNDKDPFSINGGFRDMNSNKSVRFTISDIDTDYAYLIVYYSRATSDVNQNRIVEVKKINKQYAIDNKSTLDLIITGAESTLSSTIDELNEQYTILNSVKTTAQQSNILFSGNITTNIPHNKELIELSRDILPFAQKKLAKNVIGNVSGKDYKDTSTTTQTGYEYYNTQNIYYNVGYWNEEFYRVGVVYIFNDNSLSPVYNTRGCDGIPICSSTPDITIISNGYQGTTLKDGYYYKDGKIISNIENDKGVIRIRYSFSKNDISPDERQIYGLGFYVNDTIKTKLKTLGIKGLFFVRQKRIPTILCQAYLMPNDINSKLPIIYRRRYDGHLNAFEVFTDLTYYYKRYLNNLVGESFLFHGGEWLCGGAIQSYNGSQSKWQLYKFYFKEDGHDKAVYLKIPHVDYRYTKTENNLISKDTEYSVSGIWTIDKEPVQSTFKYYITKAEIKENYNVKYTLQFTEESMKSANWNNFVSDIYIKQAYTHAGYPILTNDQQSEFWIIQSTTNETEAQAAIEAFNAGEKYKSSNKNYDEYLDYEGRLFYFPPYSDNLDAKNYFIYRGSYERFINSQGGWSAYSPDFYIKQPYYNQFFAGNKFTARIADFSTPFYDYGKDESNNKFSENLTQQTHKYLTQKGDFRTNDYRYYYVDEYRYRSKDSELEKKSFDYKDIFAVSITDTSSVGATQDKSQRIFRATAGNAEEALKFRTYWHDIPDTAKVPHEFYNDLEAINVGYGSDNYRLQLDSEDLYNTTPMVRGIYSPYIGISPDNSENTIPLTNSIGVGEIINIYIPGFKSEVNTYNPADEEKFDFNSSAIKQYMDIRMADVSQYYPISERQTLDKVTLDKVYYRGDCFISTFTERINRNFQDPGAPTNDIIVDNETWNKNGWGTDTTDKLNRGDVNAVQLGSWITFKCCTNYNVSIRSTDESHTAERALTGSVRSFYPLQQISTDGSTKIPESQVMNDGFNSTVGEKYYFTYPDAQYVQNQFQNRIYYSDVYQDSNFKNGYRIVRSTHFRDFNPEYGSITKLVPYNDNLLVIFEHAIGICQIYEKNLISQDTGSQVYINSNNILPSKLTILSDIVGSKWQDSIIKTPYAVYGIDTSTKKIWKVDSSQVTIISDFKVEYFLNSNINLSEKDSEPYLGIRNIKTHYNQNKSEVMFTFYNNNSLYEIPENQLAFNNFTQWNLAYNEINKTFTTFYSWIPSYSANIDNIFYSFNNLTTLYLVNKIIFNDNSTVKQDNKVYLYRHGVIDRINDGLQDIPKPTYWYDHQEPFEFEFTVRDDPSVQKIWNNLQIISNKATPQSFHFEIVGDSYDFKKDKPNIYYRQEATKELWHNMGSHIKYNTSYIKTTIPNYEYTIMDRYTTQSPYKSTGGVSKSTYFPLYYKRQKFGIDLFYLVKDSIQDRKHSQYYDWKYLSGSEIKYDERELNYNILTHIQCTPRDKYGILRSNSEYLEDRWNIQIPLINMVQKNENEWKVPPLIIDYLPNDLETNEITESVLPSKYKGTAVESGNYEYWPNNLDLNKWTATKQMPLRDKYIKIRIRYDGTEKAIISAIKTIYTESYS